MEQEGDGVLQLPSLRAQACEDRLPASLPLPCPHDAWAVGIGGARLRACQPPRWSGALATHLRQFEPDGLGAVSGAVVEFQGRGSACLQGAPQVELLQVPQGDGAAQCLGKAGTGLDPLTGVRVGGGRGWPRCPAHLGAGVHEDEVLAVQPQEAGSGQRQVTRSQHHVDSVTEKGQLAGRLWGWRGDTEDGSSGAWGPALLAPM